jgi:hypothetical protein
MDVFILGYVSFGSFYHDASVLAPHADALMLWSDGPTADKEITSS